MRGYFLVFLGAGMGGAMRHGVNQAAMRLAGPNFPFGTFAVNVAGSLVMGLLVGWFAHRADPGQAWRLFLTTGILGGFTTFSAFSLDALTLWDRGQAGLSALYVAGSVLLSLAGIVAGMSAARWAFA